MLWIGSRVRMDNLKMRLQHLQSSDLDMRVFFVLGMGWKFCLRAWYVCESGV